MIAEDRAAIIAWQLFGRQVSIEWFRSELERQTTPAWNRAVAAIAGAIRDAEAEARALATEAVGWRRHDASETEFASNRRWNDGNGRSTMRPPGCVCSSSARWRRSATRTSPITDATQPASSEASGTYQCGQSTHGSLGFMLRLAQTGG